MDQERRPDLSMEVSSMETTRQILVGGSCDSYYFLFAGQDVEFPRRHVSEFACEGVSGLG